jgi:hypothetical protein
MQHSNNFGDNKHVTYSCGEALDHRETTNTYIHLYKRPAGGKKLRMESCICQSVCKINTRTQKYNTIDCKLI